MKPQHLALIVALLANAVANLLIRHGMRSREIDPARPLQALSAVLSNGSVLAGIALFAVNVLAYSYVLSKIPVSTAYPIMTSVGFLIVISASMLLMGERMSGGQLAGAGLILVGVVLVARGL